MAKDQKVVASAGFKKTTDRGKKHFNITGKVQGSLYMTPDQLEQLGADEDSTLQIHVLVKD